MKRIAIITNKTKDTSFSVTEKIITLLLSHGAVVYLDKNTVSSEVALDGRVVLYDEFPPEAELIIVVGGDGSVIDASKFAIENGIPMLGVNLGKIGYLTEVDPENIELLNSLFTESFEIEEKMLLEVRGIEGKLAVNDVVISHESYLGVGQFRVEDEEGNSIKYRADGVIVATPQGSTAYSLSAGGPVVAHNVESIVLTPVAPHSFFNRSVLFDSSDILNVTNEGEAELHISIDGRCIGMLGKGAVCTVSRSEKKLKMLTFSANSMFSCLFKKMRLLEDIT